ncbi:MAG TPA: host attachment protein [Ramlibacter sp.]|nr:host attachment protein [Ramlibacter sp.]
MKPDWILIANATRARLLQLERNERVTELETFDHPQSRSKISDLVDDRAGHESTDRSYGGTSYQPRTDPKQKEHQRFAREISEFLERQAHSGSYRSLAVFASSPFLGELKAELGAATTKLLSGTHDLDLTSVGPAELGRRIAREVAH